MQRRPLGRTGLKVPPLCLGTMIFGRQIGEEAAFSIMDKAFEAGVDFFDTADMYAGGETERIIGRWLAKRGLRDRILLATKCHFPMGPSAYDGGLSRFSIVRAVEASLERLGTDVIDLYQAHAMDPETPIEETLRAFDDLVRAGKVRYIGCSNFSAWRLAEAHSAGERLGRARFQTIQPRYNLMYREIETELLPYARASGTGVIVYNPLAGGVLSGKYRRGEPPPPDSRYATLPEGPIKALYNRWYFQDAQLEAVERLREAVRARGVSLPTLAIAWVVRQPGITSAIIGASSTEQLDATLPAPELEIDAELAELCDSLWWELPRQPVVDGYR